MSLGVLVTGVMYRYPGLLAKIVTTLTSATGDATNPIAEPKTIRRAAPSLLAQPSRRLRRAHASGTGDPTRLCELIADGRLDGQVELESPWREPTPALDALLHRRIGGKTVLHVD